MLITHVIPYLGRNMGGPVAALAGYVAALVEKGSSVAVVAAPRPADGPMVDLPPAVKTVTFTNTHGGMFRRSPAMARFLAGSPAAIVHSHGLWTYASYAAGYAARCRAVPHVLAPCGMLQAGALDRSAWKKRLCRVAFQDRVLREAACLHAKSPAEQAGLRALGLRNPVAIIPNPVSRPADDQAGDPAVFRTKYGLDGRRIVLYIGRIHPVKGLRRLVQAWAALGGRQAGWQLVLGGPDECGLQRELEARRVRLVGPLYGADKWAAYRAAELFVMPSDFENFGSAVVEAMSAGLPVITTTGTPWSALPEQGAGWWVAPSAEALGRALDEALGMSENDRRMMGARAEKMTGAFTPDKVGGQLVQLYAWLCGQGARPACVSRDG